jgi:hypothetical protein
MARALAAERPTGIGPGAAARHVEGRGTSPASSASRVAVERLTGLAGLDRAPLATVKATLLSGRSYCRTAGAFDTHKR